MHQGDSLPAAFTSHFFTSCMVTGREAEVRSDM